MDVQSGATRQALTKDKILNLAVPVPPIATQHQIVAEIEKQFSRLDEAVANLKRVRANVKRYRGAVLSAAAEGTLLGGKKAGGGAVTLGAIAQRITSGSRDWSRHYGRGRGTFVLAQNVRPGRLDMTMRQAVDPPPGDRDRARSQVERDDILVTIVGANTGDVCRVDREYQEHYVCQSVALIRLHDPRLAPVVTLYMLSPNHGQRQFEQFMYGQGRPHLSFDQLKTMLLDMAPKDEQSRIVAEGERRLSMADENEAQVEANLRRAEALRRAILKRAFEAGPGSDQGTN
jgi:type I restriction enzyme S subunit